ncbi:MAG: fused MFS/spermidine synthase [Burkholderiales bacterium]|nr:fused MFS/spermidine synthase [Burkholderiales bacterium]
MPTFALTIFASAFLLFLVQPIVAKEILPWFGGSAAVWATCLVFFQTTLLLGYAYADYTVRRLAPRTAVRLHVALLVLSVVTLPIIPAAHFKPIGDENPIFLILGLLAATIGLPYFLLSTTSPLVQAWFARRFPGRNPYRLFALSNLASLVALLGYPFLLEPWIATRVQAWSWSAAYVVFVVLAAVAALASLKRAVHIDGAVLAGEPSSAAIAAAAVPAAPRREAPPTAARQALWCTLAATGSLLLLAVTNHITQNVAAVPLLWILPLTIYLVTFILCFDSSGWYRRRFFLVAVALVLGAMAWVVVPSSNVTHNLALQVGVFSGGLFLACMFCHGELVELKPAPAYLTRFYLMVALGGAVGSALIGIVAPMVLPADFELAATLALCALLLLWQTRRLALPFPLLAMAALIATVGFGARGISEFYDSTIVATRNFYGVLRVQETDDSATGKRRSLVHGNIMHGKQYFADDLKREPTSYYSAHSGIGRVIEALHPSTTPIKVGVIGLGAGTIAAYGSTGDVYRFYDINPGVIAIARHDFTYLTDSDATIELPLGDARLSLERESPRHFDVLAIDAFSSDAIPVHLITTEAVQVYLRHMKPDGVIAFHVTNRYLDLVPVVEGIAHDLGLTALWIDDDGSLQLANSSSWVLLARDPKRLADPRLTEAATPIVPRRDWRVWTDDFNNLLQVLK